MRPIKIIGNIGAIVLSGMAVVISIYTLYISQLQSAQITVFSGEEIVVWRDVGIPHSISFPITFNNSGATLGVIGKVALLIRGPKKESPYLVEAKFFADPEKGKTRPEPVAIPGHSSILKHITFTGMDDLLEEGEGPYEIAILVWEGKSNAPTIEDFFSFVIPIDDISILRTTWQSRRYVTSKWKNWKTGYVTDPKILSFLPKESLTERSR